MAFPMSVLSQRGAKARVDRNQAEREQLDMFCPFRVDPEPVCQSKWN
jgi:hypothetical protein